MRQNGAPDPNFNFGNPIEHHTTHAARVTHSVKEHHAIRTLSYYKNYHSFKTDFTDNAANSTDIAPGMQMEFYDPLDMELVVGDAQQMS